MWKGFYFVGIVLVFLGAMTVLFYGGILGMVIDADEEACTQEVKECGDGVFVSRNPDNGCEFDPCPPPPPEGPEINCEGLGEPECRLLESCSASYFYPGCKDNNCDGTPVYQECLSLK